MIWRFWCRVPVQTKHDLRARVLVAHSAFPRSVRYNSSKGLVHERNDIATAAGQSRAGGFVPIVPLE